MANLYSQYVSGVQLVAGILAGSSLGASGLNPVVDRLNSITQSDNNIGITGSFVNNKTSYKTFDGTQWISQTGNHQYSAEGALDLTGGDVAMVGVSLPHGAVVTGAVVFGNDAVETWTLTRFNNDDASTTVNLATANINTKDTSISNATIDNDTYRYFFVTSVLDASDLIYSGEITYTTEWI